MKMIFFFNSRDVCECCFSFLGTPPPLFRLSIHILGELLFFREAEEAYKELQAASSSLGLLNQMLRYS